MHAFSPVLNSSLIAKDEGLAQDLEPQSGAGRLSKSRPVRGGKFFRETMRRFNIITLSLPVQCQRRLVS